MWSGPSSISTSCPALWATAHRTISSSLARLPLDFPRVDFRLEPDQQFAAEIEHRPLDHRGLRGHQRERLAFVEALLVAVGQFAEGGAGAIEQGFPAEFIGPAFQFVPGDACGLVVMKAVRHAMAVEPGAGLLHGVA